MDSRTQEATNLAGYFHTGAENARRFIKDGKRSPDQYEEAQKALQAANEGRRFTIEPMDRIIARVSGGVSFEPHSRGIMASYTHGDRDKGYPVDLHTITFSEWGSKRELVLYQGKTFSHTWWPVNEGVLVLEKGDKSQGDSYMLHSLYAPNPQTILYNPQHEEYVSQSKGHEGVCIKTSDKIELHLVRGGTTTIEISREERSKGWFFVPKGIFVRTDEGGYFRPDMYPYCKEKDKVVLRWSDFSAKIEDVQEHPSGILVIEQLSYDASMFPPTVIRRFTLWYAELDKTVVLYEGECSHWRSHENGIIIITRNDSFFLYYHDGKSELLYKGPTFQFKACSFGLLVCPSDESGRPNLVILCPTAYCLNLIKGKEFGERTLGTTD